MGLCSSSDRWTAHSLARAARNGDVELIHKCIAAGVNVNSGPHLPRTSPDYISHPAAFEATSNGHAAALKRLAAAGADLTASNSQGQMPIHAAASTGRVECLQFFRDSGIDLSTPSSDGKTTAHFAARTGQTDCLRFLKEAGIELNQVDSNGFKPVHSACMCGSIECLTILLESGADASACATQGLTTLNGRTIEEVSDLPQCLIQDTTD